MTETIDIKDNRDRRETKNYFSLIALAWRQKSISIIGHSLKRLGEMYYLLVKIIEYYVDL
ncbi:hypothetical protein RINTHM_9490 [Richelia intracellularis HM01]|nr:hypothetical protein RINTHM_9490 [Richelia intracellularis HM01]